MENMVMLKSAEPRDVLQKIIDQRIPAIMSYSSEGRWHGTKVYLTYLGATRLILETEQQTMLRPMDVAVGQNVGISVKYGHGKFIFRSTITALEGAGGKDRCSIAVISAPASLEMVQRRSYFRVKPPTSLTVNARLWRNDGGEENNDSPPDTAVSARIIDISAGGVQLAGSAGKLSDFRAGQVICVWFAPMPYEKPLCFNGKVRSILPTADGENLCLGLQIVGLESSIDGHKTLQRLCKIIESYYQANQQGVKNQDLRTTSL